MPKPLNILYLHSHDTGRTIQPYGFAVPTPNLQKFAEQGVLFRRAFSAAPACSASRSAMLTGQPPHVCGMLGLASPRFGWELNDYSTHLVRYLGSHGYTTALAGIQHELPGHKKPFDELGYHHWLTGKNVAASDNAPKAAMDFLNGQPEGPFFLSMGLGETHRDNHKGGHNFHYDQDTDPDTADGRYCQPPGWIPDTPTTRKDFANFKLGAKKMDDKMGAVLDALDANGYRDNTLVIITTDHGLAWPHAKCNTNDMGLGVMLMMRGPADSLFTGGKVIDPMVQHLDLFPTLVDLLDLPQPNHKLHGKSLLPLLNGDVDNLHEEIFGEQTYHGVSDPMRSVRTERYRYTRRMGNKHIRICDPGPTNNWMKRLGYKAHPAGDELLYDLFFDPYEQHNLADDPAHEQVLDQHRHRLDEWMHRTGDFFPDGELPGSAVLPDAVSKKNKNK